MTDAYLEPPAPDRRGLYPALASVVAVLLIAEIVAAMGIPNRRASGTYPTGAPAAIVARAASLPASTASIGVRTHFVVKVPGRDFSFDEAGVEDVTSKRASFELKLPDAVGGGATITLIGDPTTAYVSVPPAKRAANNGRPWVAFDAAKYQGAELGSGPDLLANLKLLSLAGQDVKDLGHADVGGVATTRYEAQIDIAKLATKLSTEAQQALSALRYSGTEVLPPVTMDVWIDGAGFAREVENSTVLGATETHVTMYFTPSRKVPVIEFPPEAEVARVDSMQSALRVILR